MPIAKPKYEIPVGKIYDKSAECNLLYTVFDIERDGVADTLAVLILSQTPPTGIIMETEGIKTTSLV